MRSRAGRIAIALAGALLCAAAGAGSASAKAKPVLHLEAGGTALAPGAPIRATGSSFTLESGDGTVTCTDNLLLGSMTTNLAKKDLVTLEAGLFAGEEEGSCSSTYVAPENEAVVIPELMPWELRMSSKGKAEIKSTSPKFKGGVELRLKPLNPPEGHGDVACLYDSGKLKTKFATNGEPVVLTFTAIKFALAANSGNQCTKRGISPVVSATLALSSGGEPVTATVAP